MGGARSSHINRLRNNAGEIFGPEFPQKWFATRFKRATVPKLQDFSGVKDTLGGKEYPVFPPILFPNGIENKKDVFLNPALVNVSILYLTGSCYAVY